MKKEKPDNSEEQVRIGNLELGLTIGLKVGQDLARHNMWIKEMGALVTDLTIGIERYIEQNRDKGMVIIEINDFLEEVTKNMRVDA